MASHAEMAQLIHELRHAPTQTTPIELVERVQHVIVKLESIMTTATAPSDVGAVIADARRLIADCDSHKRR